jgi:hypothetical protein
MQDYFHDLRHGVRLVTRQPAFATVVLVIMAVAIGMVVATFSIADAWLFRSLRFPDADRLVVVFAATKARPDEPAVWLPYRTYVAFKDSARSFASISAAFFQGVTWRTESDAKSLVGMRVTPEFFSTFGVQAIRGRALSAQLTRTAGPGELPIRPSGFDIDEDLRLCLPPMVSKRSLPRPTDAELVILRVLWEHAPMSVRQIQETLDAQRPGTGCTTVLKLIQILRRE